LAAGTKEASLLYFTDRVHSIGIDDQDAQLSHDIMQAIGDKMLQLTGQIYDYRLHADQGRYGYTYAVRRFTIPDEAFEKITKVLATAEVECQRLTERYRLIMQPKAVAA